MLKGVTEEKVESPGSGFGSNNQNLPGLSQRKHWYLGRPINYLSIFCKGFKIMVMSINSSLQLQHYSLSHFRDNLCSHTISNCWTQRINFSWRLQLLQSIWRQYPDCSVLLMVGNSASRWQECCSSPLQLEDSVCLRLWMLMVMTWPPWRYLMCHSLPWEQLSSYCWSVTSKMELWLRKFCRSFHLCPSL